MWLVVGRFEAWPAVWCGGYFGVVGPTATVGIARGSSNWGVSRPNALILTMQPCCPVMTLPLLYLVSHCIWVKGFNVIRVLKHTK